MTSRTIGIWSGGLVRLSTAAYFARKGIRSLIYDIDATQVSRINNSEFHLNLEDWIGFSITEFIANGSIRSTMQISDLLKAALKVHFVAVQTERLGEPYMEAIKAVLEQITHLSPDLCIIESTVTPGMTGPKIFRACDDSYDIIARYRLSRVKVRYGTTTVSTCQAYHMTTRRPTQ